MMKVKKIDVFMLLLIVLLIPVSNQAGIAIVGGLTNEMSALPGQTVQGVIFVRNDGEENEDIRVYQRDYLFFSDGTNKYGEPGEVKRSNAKWINFSPRQITIPPREKAEIHYTVTVPLQDGLIGSYWTMLMVEPVPDPLKARESQEGINIKVLMRYGIQVITHIGDTGDRRLKFLNTKIRKDEGRKILQIDIENVGERMLRPFVWVELYDESGRHTETYEGLKRRTYPGTSIRQEIDISEVKSGTYKALVVADCGGDDIFGINYTLQIEE
jgi:hypothetical protein